MTVFLVNFAIMTQRLFTAASAGDCDAIRRRLAEGDEVDFRHTRTGRTCLIEAVINGHKEAAQLLLDSGADVCAADKRGFTSLMWAAHEGHVGILQLLIERGVDVNATPDGKRSAAMIAAGRGHGGILRCLSTAGADLNYRDRRGRGAMEEAIDNGHDNCQRLLNHLGVAEPSPPPVEKQLEWPELAWDPATITPGFVLPDGVSPEEVVLSYILTKHYWETSAYQHQEEDPDVYEAELARGEALSKAHLTERKQNDMCVSISSPPRFSLGYVIDACDSGEVIAGGNLRQTSISRSAG